jgi:hypothetical protein
MKAKMVADAKRQFGNHTVVTCDEFGDPRPTQFGWCVTVDRGEFESCPVFWDDEQKRFRPWSTSFGFWG